MARDKEKSRECSRRWREANPEKSRECSRRWREANPEKSRERYRRWSEANQEKNREWSRRYRHRILKEHEEFYNKVFSVPCGRCGLVDDDCIEAHHIDDKCFEIWEAFNRKATPRLYGATVYELGKCVMLCLHDHIGRFHRRQAKGKPPLFDPSGLVRADVAVREWLKTQGEYGAEILRWADYFKANPPTKGNWREAVKDDTRRTRKPHWDTGKREAIAESQTGALHPAEVRLIGHDAREFKPAPHANAKVHERIMARLRVMTPEEVFQTAVHAGIYTPDGKLTEPYTEDEDEQAPTTEEETGSDMDAAGHQASDKGDQSLEESQHADQLF